MKIKPKGWLDDSLESLNNRSWIHLIIPGLVMLISLVITLHNVSLGVHYIWEGEYTYYNNFLIFKHSFAHLIHNQNLYEHYPNEYGDLFKYSPTFAAMMGIFAYLPDLPGLFLWNLLNLSILTYALTTIKQINNVNKLVLFLFILPELILSTQNSQSNALLAGLTILVYGNLEKGNNTLATLCIVAGLFIKVYSIVGFLLLLLYPNKLRSLLTLLLWFVLFFLMPLLFIDPGELIGQYRNWYALLVTDLNASNGMSLFAYTQPLFPVADYKTLTMILGITLLFVPMLNYSMTGSGLFKIQYLSLLLIWMVVFNHKAESPTYIIAMTGIAIWFFTNRSVTHTILAILAFIFTSLWFTDLVPGALKAGTIVRIYLKSVFPVIIFFMICLDMTFSKNAKICLPVFFRNR